MKLNGINANKQLFLSNPQRIFQSLAWVALAILALPTVIGSYLALKKAVEVWSKSEKADTEKTDAFVSGRLKSVNDEEDEEDFSILPTSLPLIAPIEEKKELYKAAISQFCTSACLGSRSVEAYFDYLDSTERDFHYNMNLLPNLEFTLPELKYLLQTIAKEVEEKSPSLIFMPFLLAGSMFREQHIVVAVINTAKQQIEYFDPKGGDSSMGRSLAQNKMSAQDFLENLSRAAFPNKEPAIIRNANGPQSFWNKVDCGVHVLDFIQTRLYTDLEQSGKPNYFNTFLSSDAERLRKEMAGTLQARLTAMSDSDFLDRPFARA